MNHHYQAVTRFKINMDFVVAELSPRDELIASLRAARIYVKTGNASLIRKGNIQIVECKKQLALLEGGVHETML